MARYAPFIASGLIIVALGAGFLLMPRIMRLASGGGPIVGALIAVAFIVAIFVVLWLRSLYQHRLDRD
jgi:hypothetical protein